MLINEDFATILPKLPKVDLILTDPPFGINYQNNYTHEKHRRIEGDDTDFDYSVWGRMAFDRLNDNCACFAYTCWSRYGYNFKELESVGFKMKEPLIVQKRSGGTGDLRGSFQPNADWVLFGTKGRFVFQSTELLRNKKAGVIPDTGRKPIAEFKQRFPSVWFGEEYPYSTENPSTLKKWGIKHPTVKSVDFLKWLILLSTKPGDTVLDPFCGSGSTLVAAKATGRKYIGIEIDEIYCELARERLEQTKKES